MANKLPEKFRDRVSEFPEQSYGVNLVTLILDDGTRIPQVRIAWGGEIIGHNRADMAGIDLMRIVDIESDI